jgi:hypothetical protein
MKNLFIAFIPLILLVMMLSVTGCDAPTDLNPPGDDFAGYIYFVDTNFTFSSDGFYAVSLYSDSVELFKKKPLKTDSLLAIVKKGSRYEAAYKMHGIPTGKYCIAATWVRYPVSENNIPIVLGIYGCDTSNSCASYKKVIFPNFTGNFHNIFSWADTSRSFR